MRREKESKKDKDEDWDTSEEEDLCIVCLEPFPNPKESGSDV